MYGIPASRFAGAGNFADGHLKGATLMNWLDRAKFEQALTKRRAAVRLSGR